MEAKRYVVGLGEVLWDLLPDGRKLGGAPANFAFHAGRLLGPDNAIAVSALGEDALAAETVAALHKHGLNALLPRVPFPTGTVQVTLSDGGIPTYDIREDVAWDNIPFMADVQRIAAHCRAVCFGSLAQRHSVSRNTIRQFLDATPADCLKVFDINLRQHYYSEEMIRESIRRSDILKINDEELEVVSRMFSYPAADAEQTCRRILEDYHLRLLVLTCGTHGSYVFTSPSCAARFTASYLPTPTVEVADTVGAGDSFTGAFVASILLGRPVPEAHRIAVQVSAYVCTQPGAMPDGAEAYVTQIF